MLDLYIQCIFIGFFFLLWFWFYLLESGIIADISPDNEAQLADKVSTHPNNNKIQNDNHLQLPSVSHVNVIRRIDSIDSDDALDSSSNPYISNDSMAVHL